MGTVRVSHVVASHGHDGLGLGLGPRAAAPVIRVRMMARCAESAASDRQHTDRLLPRPGLAGHRPDPLTAQTRGRPDRLGRPASARRPAACDGEIPVGRCAAARAACQPLDGGGVAGPVPRRAVGRGVRARRAGIPRATLASPLAPEQEMRRRQTARRPALPSLRRRRRRAPLRAHGAAARPPPLPHAAVAARSGMTEVRQGPDAARRAGEGATPPRSAAQRPGNTLFNTRHQRPRMLLAEHGPGSESAGPRARAAATCCSLQPAAVSRPQ